MTRAIITDRIDATDGAHQLVLVLDEPDAAGEQAILALGGYGYEGDGVLYIVATDGWIEYAREGDVLTADVMAYPLKDLDLTPFPETSSLDQRAHRLLRVRTPVGQAVPLGPDEGVAVWFAKPSDTDEDVVAAINAVEDWPLIFAPGPATD
ncbi:hypothetical protein ACIQNU_24330 [Streptomyces sp. NPDC091292]|uniref:hypothetical protein n=1 Tax=Streptomyces sp. NPDC091292 TaxID=3365991 RepID=UPI00380DDAA8